MKIVSACLYFLLWIYLIKNDMNSISKLEKSIRKLLYENSSVKTERDKAFREAKSAQIELRNANVVIESLRNELEGLTKKIEKSAIYDSKKAELKGRIESIIERVELLNIDDITND